MYGTGAHCLDCSTEYTTEYVREAVFANEICTCSRCGGLVKPRIVFFGQVPVASVSGRHMYLIWFLRSCEVGIDLVCYRESLPTRFFRRMVDLKQADLLIVMGTSLVVHPFASLIGTLC
jgi:NAD-dependent SIR2 family protein deacetylase